MIGKLAVMGGIALASLAAPACAASIDPAQYDWNRDGQISGAEGKALLEALNKTMARPSSVPAAKLEIPDRRTTELSGATIAGEEPVAGKRKRQTNLYLSRSLKEPNLLDGVKALTPESGALFSYTRTFDDGNDTFAAEGALYLGILNSAVLDDEANIPVGDNSVLVDQGFLIGTSFNIVDDDAPGKKVDQLNFDLGYQHEIVNGLFDAEFFRLWAHHKSDTDLKSSVLAVSADWVPISYPLLLNVPQNRANGQLRFRPTLSFNAQAATVLDPGDKPALAKVDDIYGVGLNAGLDVWLMPEYFYNGTDPKRAPWLHLYAGYQNAWGHLGDDATYQDLWNLRAELFLGDSPNWTLSADYKNGEEPYTGEEFNQIVVGLAILLGPSEEEDGG